MANENTCVRCGKPCASGDVMCAECNNWLHENGDAEMEKTVAAVADQPETATKPAAVKNCVHCDGMIPTIAEFCPHCGKGQTEEVKKTVAPIEEAPEEEVKEQPVVLPQPQSEEEQEQKSSQKGLIIGLAVLIVVLLAALATMLVLGLKDMPAVEGQGTGLGVIEPSAGLVVPEQEAGSDAEQGAASGEETGDQAAQDTEEPVAVACRNCGVAITTADTVCPYCEWDQSLEPEEETDEPLTAAVGYTDDVTGWTTVTIVNTSETSSIIQGGSYNNTAAVTIDDDLTTSWQEGASGYGIGESIQLDFDGERQIRGLALWLGNWRSSSLYAENGTPELLNIYINDQVLTVEFPHEMSCQYVVFSEPVPASFVMLEISSVYEGSKYQDTCISEVLVYADPE